MRVDGPPEEMFLPVNGVNVFHRIWAVDITDFAGRNGNLLFTLFSCPDKHYHVNGRLLTPEGMMFVLVSMTYDELDEAVSEGNRMLDMALESADGTFKGGKLVVHRLTIDSADPVVIGTKLTATGMFRLAGVYSDGMFYPDEKLTKGES